MVKNLPYVARLACTILFFILGNSIGCWVSAIPGFKEAFRLDNGQLGVAIMCSGIGSLVMTIPVGNFVAQHGPTSTIFTSSVLRPFFYLILPALAAWGFKPYLALFLISIVSAGSFISYNSRAHELEEIWGSPLLSSFQGALSVGGLTGSGFYSYLLSHGLSWGQATRLMYVLVGLFSFAAWLFVDFDMPPRRSQATGIHTCSSLATKSKSQGLAALSPTVLFLSLVGSFSSLCEGALGDWTSLYLQEYTHCPKHLAPFGFTAFSTSMGVCRLLGDPVAATLGRRTLYVLSSLVLSAGVVALLSANSMAAALGACAVIGCGCANLMPVVVSLSSHAAGDAAALAIAAVASTGMLGMLAGPALIGFVARSYHSLRAGMSCLLAIGVFLTLSGFALPHTPDKVADSEDTRCLDLERISTAASEALLIPILSSEEEEE